MSILMKKVMMPVLLRGPIRGAHHGHGDEFEWTYFGQVRTSFLKRMFPNQIFFQNLPFSIRSHRLLAIKLTLFVAIPVCLPFLSLRYARVTILPIFSLLSHRHHLIKNSGVAGKGPSPPAGAKVWPGLSDVWLIWYEWPSSLGPFTLIKKSSDSSLFAGKARQPGIDVRD